MRYFFILFIPINILAFSSCKQLDKKQVQLSSESKQYQQALYELVEHEKGIHYVKLDTTSFVLTIKHDFEVEELPTIDQFIIDKKIDSIAPIIPIIQKDSVIPIKTEVDSLK